MRKIILNEEQKKFIIDNYKTMPNTHIALKLGFNNSIIDKAIKNLGLVREKKPLNKACPLCGINLVFKCREACYASEKSKSLCRSCGTKKQYLDNPNKNIGEANGRKGKNLLSIWVEKYGEVIGKEKLEDWKKKQSLCKLGDKNHQYGKISHGNGMSYRGWYKGMFFRSSFELVFIHDYFKLHGLLPVSAETKDFMVTYFINNKSRNYFPDFYSPITNCVYEVKSKNFTDTIINNIKKEAAITHFKNRSIKYEIITEEDMLTFKEYNSGAIIYDFLYNLYLKSDIDLLETSKNRLKNNLKKHNKIKKLNELIKYGK